MPLDKQNNLISLEASRQAISPEVMTLSHNFKKKSRHDSMDSLDTSSQRHFVGNAIASCLKNIKVTSFRYKHRDNLTSLKTGKCHFLLPMVSFGTSGFRFCRPFHLYPSSIMIYAARTFSSSRATCAAFASYVITGKPTSVIISGVPLHLTIDEQCLTFFRRVAFSLGLHITAVQGIGIE